MRSDVETTKATATIVRFPRGTFRSAPRSMWSRSMTRTVMSGWCLVADAHGGGRRAGASRSRTFCTFPDEMLLPEMAVKEAVLAFDRAEAEALAVVDSFLDRRVIGLLTEAYVLRRYAAALEGRRRELVGE